MIKNQKKFNNNYNKKWIKKKKRMKRKSQKISENQFKKYLMANETIKKN